MTNGNHTKPNKVVAAVNFFNYRLCLKICRYYYARKEEGKGFPMNGKFLKWLVMRTFVVIFNLFRFNANLYSPYLRIFLGQPYYAANTDGMYNKIKECFRRYLGLRFFFKPNYSPAYYEKYALDFRYEETPRVSIIIPVFRQVKMTMACLRSLVHNTADESYEIILIDDCSYAEEIKELSQIKNVVYERNETNAGFVASCTTGASIARGKYLCFLNNDTLVQPGWLKALVRVLDEDKQVGLVGSMLIYPYGLLQEAGSFVFRDGTGWNYGKFDGITDNKYNMLRESDYCSGASILVRKQDFNQVGGFDLRFAPAYYEDTDLAMAIRYHLRKKVVFQPLSKVVHFEGASSGKVAKAGNVKSFQELNRHKFMLKWQSQLDQFHAAAPLINEAINRYYEKPCVTIIDTTIPMFDRDSGSNRMLEIIRMLREMKCRVNFIPRINDRKEPYGQMLSDLGVSVAYETRYGKGHIKQQGVDFIQQSDYLWICRPELNVVYQSLIKIKPTVVWVYDTVDLHFVRLAREAKLKPELAGLITESQRMKKIETHLAESADVTICITEDEKQALLEEGDARKINAVVIPNIHRMRPPESGLPFSQRSGLLFIGGYGHPPNVDAVKWLCNEIMPEVWKFLPTLKVTLLGSSPNDEVMKLANERIAVPGYISDISPYFEQARLFVAPLRYGAGMKGKIGQSFEFRLPIVSTLVGIEGMGLIDGKHLLVANEAKLFAEKIIELYQNEQLWYKLHNASEEALSPFLPSAVKKRVIDVLHQDKSSRGVSVQK